MEALQAEKIEQANPERPAAACDSCGLVQFLTEKGHCRRCKKDLKRPEATVELTEQPPIAADINYTQSALVYLKWHRQSRGMSQRQVAREMDVPQTTVSRLERKKDFARPLVPHTTIERYAEATGLTPLELYTRLDKRLGRDHPLNPPDFADQLKEFLPHIDKNERALLLNMAGHLAAGRQPFPEWLNV